MFKKIYQCKYDSANKCKIFIIKVYINTVTFYVNLYKLKTKGNLNSKFSKSILGSRAVNGIGNNKKGKTVFQVFPNLHLNPLQNVPGHFLPIKLYQIGFKIR